MIKNPSTLRLRIFAGPNGSGKSTIIKAVHQRKVNGIPIDFGIYVNADDIARDLKSNKFTFKKYKLPFISKDSFVQTAIASGLIGEKFPEQEFLKSFKFNGANLASLNEKYVDYLAQVLADFLRKQLLFNEKKFSFETVFSHESKIDIMRQAIKAGYKVYFYFISTESPEINKYRVRLRVQKGGHNVPTHLIESRYYRSLDLMFDAAQYAYQAYFFDNSDDNSDFKTIAHFKVEKGKKIWDQINTKTVPGWFNKYYLNKIDLH